MAAYVAYMIVFDKGFFEYLTTKKRHSPYRRPRGVYIKKLEEAVIGWALGGKTVRQQISKLTLLTLTPLSVALIAHFHR